MCPASSETLVGRRQDVPAEHLPEASSRRSRGHSVQKLNCLEITPPSESITIPMSILSVPSMIEATTDLLDYRLHLWISLRRQIISLVSKVQQLLFPRRLLQKITGITLAIKNTIQTVIKNLNVQIIQVWKFVWLAEKYVRQFLRDKVRCI